MATPSFGRTGNILQLDSASSKHIRTVGYDKELRELHVFFANGSHYVYERVGPVVHQQLVSASSPGNYFHAYVKSLYKVVKL